MSSSIDLNWQFWKAQIEAIKAVRSNNFDIVNLQGGYRSGKSVTGARMTILQALQNPGSTNVAMGVSFQEAKKTSFPVLFEQLPGKNIDPYLKGGNPEKSPIVHSFSKQDGILVLRIGDRKPSTISLGSADKASRYEGGSFNFVWMDETGLYRNKLFGIMKTFLERTNQQLWTTTGKTGAQKQIIEDRQDRNGDKINATIKTVKASTMKNPFLDEEKKERLKRTYGGTKNAEMALKGGFGSVEGLVYQQFNRVDHVVNREDIELNEDFGRVYAYDEGWKDSTVFLELGMTNEGQIVALDHFYDDRSDVDDVIEWVRENDKPRGRIASEHVPKDIREFRIQLSWPVEKADKDISSGIKEVRQRFQKDSKGRAGLLICEKCEELINELNNYQEDDVGGSNVRDHAADCLRYGLKLIEKTNKKSKGVQTGSVRAI